MLRQHLMVKYGGKSVMGDAPEPLTDYMDVSTIVDIIVNKETPVLLTFPHVQSTVVL